MPDLLTTLARVDRTKVFLASLAVGLAGLFLPGVLGALILYAVVIALGALLLRTFTLTSPRGLVLRVLILLGLAAIATAKLLA